jgi:flavodoxin
MAEKLVVYDSYFGNTEKIAQAIGEALGDATVRKVNDIREQDKDDLKIMFIGSPTRAFNATPAIMTFIKSLPKGKLDGVQAAAFDTRINPEQTESRFLKFMIKLFGYADVKIANALTKAGAELPIESAGFGVTGTEGPLLDGEIERAKSWADQIL